MKKIKKIFACILTCAMLLNLCGTIANVKASDVVESGAFTIHASTSEKRVLFRVGATTRPSVNAKLEKVDGSGSITLGGEEKGYLFHENGIYFLIFDDHTIEEGVLATIKGQFIASDGFIINMQETTFKYDSNATPKWAIVDEDVSVVESGALTVHNNTADKRIWVTAAAATYPTVTGTMEKIAGSGSILVEGTERGHIHHEANGLYIIVFDSHTPTDGDEVIVKGQFKAADGFVLDVEETTFVYNSENTPKWAITQETVSAVESGALTVHNNTADKRIWATAAAGTYPTVTGTMSKVAGSGSILVDGTEKGLLHHEGNGLYIVVFDSHTPSEGSEVTVKGQFEAADGFILDVQETTFVYSAAATPKWAIKVDVTEVSSGDITLGQIQPKRIWFNTASNSETLGWNAMTAVAGSGSITVNGVEESKAHLFHENNIAGLYLLEMDDLTFAANDKVVIKGKFRTADGSFVIDMKETTFICEDPTGASGDYWKIAGVEDLATYQEVTVNTAVNPSGYNSAQQRYDFYFDLNETVGDTTSTITGMKYTINDGESKALTAMMTPHTGETLLAVVWIPEVTEPTKITFSGKGVLSGNTAKGLQLKNEVSVYINEYGWSLDGFIAPTAYVETGISELLINACKYANEEQGWHFYLGLSQKNAKIAKEALLVGFKYSINDGEKKDLTAYYAGYQDGSFFFIMPELSKNITKNTKITISGQGKTTDGKNGLKLTEDITLYGNQYGWSLTGYVQATKYSNVTGKELNSATKWNTNEVDSRWEFYLHLTGDTSQISDNALLSGFEYSINGSEKKPLGECFWSPHADGTLMFVIRDLTPKKLTKNTKIIISGKAKTIDGTCGLKLTKELIIYGNQYGWSMDGYPKSTQYSKVTGKELDGATKWNKYEGDERWEFYLHLKGDTSQIPDHAPLTGFEYSINGKKTKQALSECFWSPHAGGTLLFVIRDLEPEQLKKNTKIIISGKGQTSDGAYGLELTKAVTIYGNQYGWSMGGYPKAPTYTQINVTGVNTASSYREDENRWDIYLNVDKLLPGADNSDFRSLKIEIAGKEYDMVVYHAGHQDTLFFAIEGDKMAKNVKNGTPIVLKAGKAAQEGKGIGIQLMKDVTLYKFYDGVTDIKPTTNTKYTDVSVGELARATKYQETGNIWPIYLRMNQEIPGDERTQFYELKAELNGKEVLLKATKEGKVLFVPIPTSLLNKNTKTGTFTIKAGTKTVGGHGEVGLHFTEDFNIYMFNGVWSEDQFEEMIETELFCTRLHNCTHNNNSTLWGFYLKTDKEFPGRPWYNKFDRFQVELNGKDITVELNKADGTGGRIIYFGIDEAVVGKFTEGSILKLKANSVAEDGPYKTTFTKDFSLIYSNGMWTEYRQTDKVAPEAQNLWDIARFDSAYIPQSEDGTVKFSGYDEYPNVSSTEKLMDQTIKFTGKKAYNDVAGAPFYIVLRGNPISDTEPISRSLLYGYVITMEGYEITEENTPNSPELWGTRSAFINVWKNGENAALSDQYKIGTHHAVSNDPYFKYDETYEYEVSIYNITETSVCIEFKVNGEIAYKCYDDASTDPMDPVVNPGTFGVYAAVPTIIGGETVELGTVLAEMSECQVDDKVGVAATYPSKLEGAVFAVDKKGATIEDGYFVAEKPGTYTVSATYNGKELEPVTITVSEKAQADAEVDKENNIMPIVIALAAIVVVAGAATVVILTKRRKKK